METIILVKSEYGIYGYDNKISNHLYRENSTINTNMPIAQ